MATEMMEKEFQKLHLFSLWVVCWPSGNSFRKTDLSTDVLSALAQHPGWVADTAGSPQSEITVPCKSHRTISLNKCSIFSVLQYPDGLIQMDVRSRCHLTRTRSFWLSESWLSSGSRSDLRFRGVQAALVDVFQQTGTADLPRFCPQKLPGDSAHQTLCSCRAPSRGPWMCGMVMCSCFTSSQASPGAIPAALRNGSPFLSFLLHFESGLCSASGAAEGHPEVQRTAPNSQLAQPKAWI